MEIIIDLAQNSQYSDTYSDTENQISWTRKNTGACVWLSCPTPHANSEAMKAGKDFVFEHGQTMRWRSVADERRTPAEWGVPDLWTYTDTTCVHLSQKATGQVSIIGNEKRVHELHLMHLEHKWDQNIKWVVKREKCVNPKDLCRPLLQIMDLKRTSIFSFNCSIPYSLYFCHCSFNNLHDNKCKYTVYTYINKISALFPSAN